MAIDLDRLRRSFASTDILEARRAPATHHAVVAAILRQTSTSAEVLLIERAQDERDPWSGHMGLPGGHRDERDSDLLGTAQREVDEEIGLALERDATLLGRLNSARTSSGDQGLEICPLVFALERDAALTLDPREVQSVVWASLDDLVSRAAETTFEYARPGRARMRFPAFDVRGHIVWGLTYRILRNLLEQVR